MSESSSITIKYKAIIDKILGESISDPVKLAILGTSVEKLYHFAATHDAPIEHELDVMNPEDIFEKYKPIVNKWLLSEIEFLYDTYPQSRRLTAEELTQLGLQSSTEPVEIIIN